MYGPLTEHRKETKCIKSLSVALFYDNNTTSCTRNSNFPEKVRGYPIDAIFRSCEKNSARPASQLTCSIFAQSYPFSFASAKICVSNITDNFEEHGSYICER